MDHVSSCRNQHNPSGLPQTSTVDSPGHYGQLSPLGTQPTSGPHWQLLLQSRSPQCPVAHPVTAPGEQTPCPVQAPAAHWPQLSHVSLSIPQSPHAIILVAFGVHTGTPQEHAPQLQLAEQVSVPYVLHPAVALGAHAPSPAQLPWTH
jgi:hypothetical protein